MAQGFVMKCDKCDLVIVRSADADSAPKVVLGRCPECGKRERERRYAEG